MPMPLSGVSDIGSHVVGLTGGMKDSDTASFISLSASTRSSGSESSTSSRTVSVDFSSTKSLLPEARKPNKLTKPQPPRPQQSPSRTERTPNKLRRPQSKGFDPAQYPIIGVKTGRPSSVKSLDPAEAIARLKSLMSDSTSDVSSVRTSSSVISRARSLGGGAARRIGTALRNVWAWLNPRVRKPEIQEKAGTPASQKLPENMSDLQRTISQGVYLDARERGMPTGEKIVTYTRADLVTNTGPASRMDAKVQKPEVPTFGVNSSRAEELRNLSEDTRKLQDAAAKMASKFSTDPQTADSLMTVSEGARQLQEHAEMMSGSDSNAGSADSLRNLTELANELRQVLIGANRY